MKRTTGVFPSLVFAVFMAGITACGSSKGNGPKTPPAVTHSGPAPTNHGGAPSNSGSTIQSGGMTSPAAPQQCIQDVNARFQRQSSIVECHLGVDAERALLAPEATRAADARARGIEGACGKDPTPADGSLPSADEQEKLLAYFDCIDTDTATPEGAKTETEFDAVQKKQSALSKKKNSCGQLPGDYQNALRECQTDSRGR